VLGVAGEEPQDHLQAAPAGAQQGGSRIRVDVAGATLPCSNRVICRAPP
jgi:hypothetical protein